MYQRLIPGFATNREQVLKERSVVYWVNELSNAPILLLHSETDERVHVHNAQILAQKLKEKGQIHSLITYPNGEHTLRGHGDSANKEVFSWFKQYLSRDGKLASR